MLALELIHLGTDRSKNGLSALKLGKNAGVKGGANRAIDLSNGSRNLSTLDDGSRSGHRSRLGGSGLRSLGSSRGLGGLSRSGGNGCGSGRRCDRSSGRRRSRLDHVVGYTLMSKVFLSCF
jgi:hypothetical protein